MKKTPPPVVAWLVIAAGFISVAAPAQSANDVKKQWLLGRWEVLEYSEQGVQVDKRKDALPQAVAVYQHVRDERARTWFGYDPAWESSRRRERSFDRWEERDSIAEVNRIRQAIEMPYYVVFFADSSMSMYNRNPQNNRVFLPEMRHYSFDTATMSIDLSQPGAPLRRDYGSWDIEILSLSATEMVMFIPDSAEIVRLKKTDFNLP